MRRSLVAFSALCAAIMPLGLLSARVSMQVGETLSLGKTCSYFGEKLAATVVTFASAQEAETVIRRIVEASGLARNFRVQSAGVQNAAAVVQGSTRYILYNTRFIHDVRQSTGSEWGAISIMAHEVGHHLNGHTLDQLGSRPPIELEADYFSGFVLQKLGATLADAQIAMQRLGSDAASATHPAKHDRLEAIASGWAKACDQSPQCSSGSEVREGSDQPTGTGSAKADSCRFARDGECDEPNLCDPGTDTTDCRITNRGPDSCRYARDGECDEPDLCDAGTDTTDCRVSTRRRNEDPIQSPPPSIPSAPVVASRCVTPGGMCSLPPGPIGVICTCFTPFGPIQGTSR